MLLDDLVQSFIGGIFIAFYDKENFVIRVFLLEKRLDIAVKGRIDSFARTDQGRFRLIVTGFGTIFSSSVVEVPIGLEQNRKLHQHDYTGKNVI